MHACPSARAHRTASRVGARRSGPGRPSRQLAPACHALQATRPLDPAAFRGAWPAVRRVPLTMIARPLPSAKCFAFSQVLKGWASSDRRQPHSACLNLIHLVRPPIPVALPCLCSVALSALAHLRRLCLLPQFVSCHSRPIASRMRARVPSAAARPRAAMFLSLFLLLTSPLSRLSLCQPSRCRSLANSLARQCALVIARQRSRVIARQCSRVSTLSLVDTLARHWPAQQQFSRWYLIYTGGYAPG